MPPLEGQDGQQQQQMGIIYPPREVRTIVDKTASFVARNGQGFEHKIKANEVNNPKFNFLNPGDPYHAYYQHRVKEFFEGKDEEPAAVAETKKPTSTSSGTKDVVKQRQSDLLKQATKEVEAPPPKDPPPEFEFIADPPSISAFDLDVVKLTAQFVARNGRQFLTSLMQKEQRNYQFDFLRPQHSLFQYFTKLLEQYTKVLIPPKEVTKKLQEESVNNSNIMSDIDYRVRWIKHQEAKKRIEAEQLEKERVSYAQVDWHNFVVVETVDYQPWEVGNFPPPTNPTEVGARVLMQRRVESLPPSERVSQKMNEEGGESNTNVEDMEEDSSEEEESDDDDEETANEQDSNAPKPMGKPLMAVDAAPAVNQPVMAPPPSLSNPGNVEVRAYDPKVAKAKKLQETQEMAAQEEYLVSPITGQRVPASKVQEHMRIGLLDPRWVEERNKQITEKAGEDTVFAPGQAIEHSLKHLAERRTDIFGVGEEAAQEAAIGKKMGEEEMRMQQQQGTSWDGQSSTAESAARAARGNISLADQIEQIHRAKGLIPEKEPAVGPKPTMPQAQVISAPPAPMVTAPPMPPQAPPTMVSMIPQPNVPVMVPTAAFHHPMPPFHHAPQMPPPEMMPPQMMMGGGGMDHQQQMMEGEPASKRPRGEDHLMPESEFLARNPHPEVMVRVQCPPGDESKQEWRINGQMLHLSMSVRDTVSTLKARLHDETGMPPGKQKLQLDSMFLKDGLSLAYYNMRPGMVVFLQVKERGGRKK